MKTIILTIAFVLGIFLSSKGQVTLEATYDSAAVNLYMVNLEVSGQKYVKVTRDSANRFLRLYNLNHTIWKTINCNSFPRMYYIGPPNFDTSYIYDFDVLWRKSLK